MFGGVKKEVIYRAHDEEELIRAFPSIIGEIYKGQLLERLNRPSQSEDMKKWWEEMLESDVGMVKGNAYASLRKIRLSPRNEEFEKYYLRGFGFFNTNIIRITESTGFFKELSTRQGVKIPSSREYRIDFRKLTIEAREYPPFTNL